MARLMLIPFHVVLVHFAITLLLLLLSVLLIRSHGDVTVTHRVESGRSFHAATTTTCRHNSIITHIFFCVVTIRHIVRPIYFFLIVPHCY